MGKKESAKSARQVDLENWVQSNRRGCKICRHDVAREIVEQISETQQRMQVVVKYSSIADLIQSQAGERFTDNAIRDHMRRCIGGR